MRPVYDVLPSIRRRSTQKSSRELVLAITALLCAPTAWGGTGGSVSGTVRDVSGASLPRATVIMTEVATGVTHTAEANGSGYYSFPVLPVGRYELHVTDSGFAAYTRTTITLNNDSALTLDAELKPGAVEQTVTVTDDVLHVETVSSQLGQVTTGRQMTAVPLNGRSFTDLLSLQAGVAPLTSLQGTTVQDVGATFLSPSGDLNPGTVSINGQREFANYFSVNGGNTEEDVNAGTAIVPNLDSIDEFRIVTANFDAQYGEFSGGQVNVITKSGTNRFHGNAFDFLRNTVLDARNYFSPDRGVYRQNQFGGTLGGPIHRDKAFFFIDYQGTRQTQGISTGVIGVPTAADRTGNFMDQAAGTFYNPATGQPISAVSGPYLANLLSQKLGTPVSAGEAYYYPGCTAGQCVFPNAIIPQNAWSTPAQRLLQYIPAPNTAGGFATSHYNQVLRDDKGAARVDFNTRIGLLSGYYFADDFRLDSPYPVAQSGASVPGFNALTTGRAQLATIGLTSTFGPKAANELHTSYLRDYTDLGEPVGGTGVSLVSQGFTNPDGSPSIVALDPKGESVENLNFNAFSTGAAANQLTQSNNTYQVLDSFTRIIGNHSLKLGAQYHNDQVNAHPIAQFNGNFVFNGTETGVDFADFLIGTPTLYNQSQLNPFYARNFYVGAFAQDSWRATPNLVFNYGLRWDRIRPWSEKYNQISTFVPGAQSVVFPFAPRGILYPGDPNIPETLAPTREKSFAPRVGFAWSSGNALSSLVRGAGQTSIRGSYGMFYTAYNALSIGVLAANAPYGNTYTSPAPPLFATPFVSAATGQNNGQPFPYTFAPLNSSSQHPDRNIDWSQFSPISGIPGFDIHNKTPYTQEWTLQVEQQMGAHTVLTAGYVGNASHHQLVLLDANPGNAALCLSLSQPSQVLAGTITCGPNGADSEYQRPDGTEVLGTRTSLGPDFGDNALQSTIGNANYNALQLSARYTSTRLQFAAAYTYGKSMDQSSSIGEAINPIDPRLSYALSAWDIANTFVVSYEYNLPFDQWLRPSRLTTGWTVSGITHLSTGFPVTLATNGDNSLLGTTDNGVNNSTIDEPDYNGASLHLNGNPRKSGNNYFSSAAFTANALGTTGTARRRFFPGPGQDNFDMAIAKHLALTESTALLFRVEAFNVFNHTQFFGPSAIDGNYSDLNTTFGKAVSAAPARVLQGAIKINF